MKLKKITKNFIDLSDTPSLAIVTKLKKNDLVVYEGTEWNVEVPPKKAQKGMWVVGLTRGEDKKYVKIVENTKPKMTLHEKRALVTNIKGILKLYSSDEKKMVKLVQDYHTNLRELNNYDEKDVRECMATFPIELLKKSGIVI